MSESGLERRASAVLDFRRARRKAALRKLLDRVGGGSSQLLPYDEVVRKLAGRESARWELREIPLEAIVGSVGRYKDFTRDFLPLRDSDADRWANVKVAMTGLAGLPPIQVYQVGEAYFVQDGNHRVSVARELGASHIQAYVNQVHTKAPLSPEVDLDELIIKAEQADFLKRTRLDESRPETDFAVTAPGRYQYLEYEIEAHAASTEQSGQPLPELATRWHDEVYRPVQELIRRLGMLHGFPGRTETDLYLWIARYRTELQQALGWDIPPRSAAADLLSRLGERARSRLRRRPRSTAGEVEPARREHGEARLFSEILVPISGGADDWVALHQADVIARREGGRVLGLHVAKSEREASSDRVRNIQSTFEAQCASNQAECQLAIDVGKIARTICDRARWADLVVVKLNHPPGKRPVDRLSSGFRALIRGCPRPIMAVPRGESPLTHALLAYDGSPKAEEALYLAAYLAGQWGMSLTVISVAESRKDADLLVESAGRYLDARGIRYSPVAAVGEVATEILGEAERRGSDVLIVGGYGRSPVAEVVLGSTVDRLLRATTLPVLICH